MLIGISGAAGAGKDTAADTIVACHPPYVKDKFARTLKEVLNSIFGWSMENWDDPEWKELPNSACGLHTPRYVAQTFGTDWGRNMVYPDIWVDAAIRNIEEENTVFSDVRFPNELDAIKHAGGRMIHMKVSDGAGTLTDRSDHESESYLAYLEDNADVVITVPRGDIQLLQYLVNDTMDLFMESIKNTVNQPPL